MQPLQRKAAGLLLLAVASCSSTSNPQQSSAAGAGGAATKTVGGDSGKPAKPAADGGARGFAVSGTGGGGRSVSGSAGRAAEAGSGPSTGPLKPPCAACSSTSQSCEASPARTGSGRAASVAAKLGKTHFLVGMGNDLDNDHSKDGAYTVGTTLDLHYAYMVGLPGMGGWPDWNSNGTFVNILADSAAQSCVTPMYTVYSMAARGDGNLAGLSDNTYMSAYWSAAKLLFQRLAEFGKPAVVHLEPDFWAYAALQSSQKPASMKVLLRSQAPECADLPEDVTGMGKCWIKLARMYAPKVLLGFHASQWGGSPNEIVAFFKAIGVSDTDLIVMDMLDRDAGCFEAAQDPSCKRDGTFYWDETNRSSPNFHEYLSYAKQVSDGLDKSILWWQVPFGVPSDTPGGTADHYRDNRVHYIFSHIDEFVAAGGLGVTFGAGASNQTTWKTDGGQFKSAVGKYFQTPVALP